jgi:glycosyltransferase involved in cell wall biosynthesis
MSAAMTQYRPRAMVVEACATIMRGMTARLDGSGGEKPRIFFDMTFPDRNRGGSGVYARSLVAALRERDDVEVGEIRSNRPGLARTIGWLTRGASDRLHAADAQLLHSPNFVVPWNVPVPFVTTVFDLSTRRFPGDHPLEWRAYERWIMPSRARAAARVIAISELTRQDVIATYGVEARRVVTIHLGVDSRFFQAAGQKRDGAAARRLIFPGAPVARKNLELVLSAMAAAPRESALGRAGLEISGATADRFPGQAARISSLGLADRVRWLGLVPNEEMPSVMAAADVCVYPSLYEGFGFPPLEAMASGIPVVASNASCLPEILGDAALMVDPTDVKAFGEAVEAVLVQPELNARLVAAGHERVRDFTWERCAERTVAVYRDALGEGAP